MRIHELIVLGFLASQVAGCGTTPLSPLDDSLIWHSEISDAALQEIKSTGVPSLQIAVAVDGNLIYQSAHGLADMENGVQATVDTKYRTASISKWFTATAVFAAAEAGHIDLDQPIQNYCTAFPRKKWLITTRQLIAHTSGIHHYIDFEKELANARTEEHRQVIQRRRDASMLSSFRRYTEVEPTLKPFAQDPLSFEPGSSWEYSSFGYRVLACVLEGASGKDYRESVQQNIFDVANMMNTRDDDVWALVPGRAAGYRISRDTPIRRADLRDVSENLPAGGHLSTASDLVRFAQAFNRGELVGKKTVALMLGQLVALTNYRSEPTWRDAIPSKDKYGYGMMLFPDESEFRIGHTGRQAGASSILVLLPSRNLSIAVMANAKGWDGYLRFVTVIQNIVLSNLSSHS